jgi:nucleoside-diphosphate-sugar epimerase
MRKLLRWMPELGKEEGFGFRVRMTREEMELACHHWSVDASRAKVELGWAPRDPQVTLEDTVRDLWRGR